MTRLPDGPELSALTHDQALRMSSACLVDSMGTTNGHMTRSAQGFGGVGREVFLGHALRSVGPCPRGRPGGARSHSQPRIAQLRRAAPNSVKSDGSGAVEPPRRANTGDWSPWSAALVRPSGRWKPTFGTTCVVLAPPMIRLAHARNSDDSTGYEMEIEGLCGSRALRAPFRALRVWRHEGGCDCAAETRHP